MIKWLKGDKSTCRAIWTKSLYRSVSSRAIHNWLWIFSIFLAKIKIQNKLKKKKSYKRDIMQLFSANATIIFKKYFILFLPLKTWKNCSQKLLIIGPKLFSVLPTSPKSAQKNGSLHNFYIMTLVAKASQSWVKNSFYRRK